MGEIVASRVLNTLYIYLDIGFLLFLAVTLLVLKRYAAAIFGFLGGLLYFAAVSYTHLDVYKRQAQG